VVWTDNLHQGYVRLVLGRNGGQADFVAVNTVLSQRYRTATVKRIAISPGANGLTMA
jgi:hypothetical protein